MAVITGPVASWELRWDEDHPPNNTSVLSFDDISGDVHGELICFRGRRHELDPIESGYLEFTLDTSTGEFDPMNPSGAVASGWEPTTTQITLRALISATYYTAWTGWLEDIPSPETDTNRRVRVRCVDPVGYLARIRMPRSMWDYEVEKYGFDHWYRFDEGHGSEFVDRVGTNDGTYQIRDSGTNTDTGRFKQYHEGSIIPFDADDPGAVNFGEWNDDLGEDKVSRVLIDDNSDNLNTSKWTVGIWVKSNETPRDTSGTISAEWAPSSKHQPVWTQDQTGTAWQGEKAGLMITSAGDFQALYQGSSGGTEYTAAFATGAQGWNGRTHLVWVGKGDALSSDDLWIQVDNNSRVATPGIPSTATNNGRFIIGGQFTDNVRVTGASPVWPWFRGSLQDMVILDGHLPSDDAIDLYQAGKNGLFGSGVNNPDVNDVVDKVLEIADYQQGTTVTPTATFNCAVAPAGDDTTCLEYLQLLERTEMGRMFFAADGSFIMKRENQLGGTVQMTFANDGTVGSVMWTSMDVSYGAQGSVYNDVEVSWYGGKAVRDKDATSIASYGVRSLTWDTLLRNVGPVRTRAQLLTSRYSDPVVRVNSITFRPSTASGGIAAMGLEIGETVRIKKVVTAESAFSGTYDENHVIEGIEHRISRGDWEITLYLSPDYYTT